MRKANLSQSGVIFNIQKFSVHDGPGIRTVVFFKGCPLRCRWCSNPESQLSKIQILWDTKKCIGCEHCVAVCPANAIQSSENEIKINHSLCLGCKECVLECPKHALKTEGEIKTVKEVLDVVLQDVPFYEESQGGVTLSGGEIFSQPDFATELLIASKENSLHTCCETTGFTRPEIFDAVTEYLDLILFDLKHWNSEKHKEGTGISNELCLSNMKRAIQHGKEVLPRIPVIPNFNFSLEDAAQFAELLHAIGAKNCQLLPFHQFGENKYHMLNQSYAYENIPSLHTDDLFDYLNVFSQFGLHAFF